MWLAKEMMQFLLVQIFSGTEVNVSTAKRIRNLIPLITCNERLASSRSNIPRIQQVHQNKRKRTRFSIDLVILSL